MGRRVRRLIWGGLKVALIAGIAASGVWWLRFAPVRVDVHQVETGTVIDEVMGTGSLEAHVRAAVGPRITGRLATVLVDQGDRVTGGQLVATLYDGDLRQRVEIAKAELAVARAGVEVAAAAIVRAEANAVHARTSFLRVEPLAAQQVLSSDELDLATQQRDLAEADLRLAQLAKVESEHVVVKATEGLRYDQERLADTRIVAPFDALVVKRDREPGDVVVPGGTIIDVVSTEELWISAWVDETALGRLAPGQPARVVFRSAPDTSILGTVVRLAPQTDAETRELLIDVALSELPATWAIGQRAEIYVETERREDVLVLPQQLIVWHKGVPRVLVDDAGVARWRDVVLGLRGTDTVEVIRGVVAGESVILIADGSTTPREGRQLRRAQP